MLNFLSGYKTYLTGFAMMLTGAGMVFKDLSEGGINMDGVQMFMSGAAFVFLRKGVEAKK